MSIPTEVQEGSMRNLMICMNTAIALLQELDKEPTLSDAKFRKMLVSTMNNLIVALCSIGQCVVQDMTTQSILTRN